MPEDRADPRKAPAARRRTVYGRRVGRALGPGRRRLVAEFLPRLRVTVPDGADGGAGLDPRALFAAPPPFAEGSRAGPVADIWLEVGFGAGEHLLAHARAHPEVGFIGCEPFLNGIAALLAGIAAERLDNIRVFPDDARLLLDHLGEATLGRVFVLFPDPWPKARHAKRRFVSAPTLDALARTMADGAELRVASDDRGYVRWTLRQVLAHPGFQWTAECAADWRARPGDQAETRYEAKARSGGGRPVFLAFRRRPRAGRPGPRQNT